MDRHLGLKQRVGKVVEQRRMVGGERERLLEQLDRALVLAGLAAEVAEEEQRLGIERSREVGAFPALARGPRTGRRSA